MTLLAKGESQGLTEKSVKPKSKQQFYVGCAWEGDVDLDLVACPVKDGKVDTNDVLYFGRTSVFAGALAHSGDALTGIAAGDDESLVFDPSKLPADITDIVVGVIAYNVPDMSAATDTKFSIRDGEDFNAPLLFDMPIGADDIENETVLVGAVISRKGADDWTVKNASEYKNSFAKGMPALQGLIDIAPHYI